MKFDLLIRGGEVVDLAAGYSGKMDVAIKHDRISAVDYNIPIDSAHQTIDANNQFVTPGLIDLHTHVYWGATYWGVRADPIASRTGVTTWLDAGSAGAITLPGFREFIVKPANICIHAFLNISYIGMVGSTHELANLDYCDVDLFEKVVHRNRDLVLGVKVRVDRNTTRETGVEPLKRARQAADQCELPLMIHIGQGPPGIEDVLAVMKPGDILTHSFTGHSMRLIDARGNTLESTKRALDAGVIVDVGHGVGSFSFETAEALMAGGYRPDVISTDIHQFSINGPMFDLPTCLSKFLCLGMSFPEVIRAATSRPAEVLGLQNEVGTLKIGARADLALFTVERGRFPLYDVHMSQREGKEMIRNTLTIAGGKMLAPLTVEPPALWVHLSEDQRELMRRGHTPTAMVAGV